MVNKVKEKVWIKDQWKFEGVLFLDVVWYKDLVFEYDLESYERYMVENNFDYQFISDSRNMKLDI